MAKWKGLILAGGNGSRLFPLTKVMNKHLLPVYDKPMIYYPLATLMLGGIREFVIVTRPDMMSQFEQLIGTGKNLGIEVTYVAQKEPNGIAHGLLVAQKELAGHNVALILGDNILYGTGLPGQISRAMKNSEGATIFGYEVNDPSAFGVVELDRDGRPVSLMEKPANPASRLAVPGLYFYDQAVIEIASSIMPSDRGELEITDVNKAYMERGDLRVYAMGRGTAWLDGGSHYNLFEASQFVKIIEERTGLKIACPEEVAYRMGYISLDKLENFVTRNPDTGYTSYLRSLVEHEHAANSGRGTNQ